MSCVEPLGHAAAGEGEPSSDLQAGSSSGNFKDTKEQPAGRPPPLTRAVSWMVEEKKISEEKDENEEEEKEEESDGKEEERRKLLPPTLIPGPPRSSRQASVDQGSLGIRSRQGSFDSRDPVMDPKIGRRGPDGDQQRGSRKGSVDRATGTDPERSPVQVGIKRIEIEPKRESSCSPRTDPEYYRQRGTNNRAGCLETERITLRQDIESRRGRPPVRQMSNLETGRSGMMMTRSSSIESSSSEIMKIRNLVSIRRGSIDRGMTATEVKPRDPETASSAGVQTPVYFVWVDVAKAFVDDIRRKIKRTRPDSGIEQGVAFASGGNIFVDFKFSVGRISDGVVEIVPGNDVAHPDAIQHVDVFDVKQVTIGILVVVDFILLKEGDGFNLHQFSDENH